MPSLSKIKQVTLIALQKYPEIAARYNAGDPSVTAPIEAMQHMLAELGRDVDVSEIEPFVKSREASILADASNKGILPTATPCQHYVDIINTGTERVTIAGGRLFEDGQGRTWRFLQSAEILAKSQSKVLAEQSQIRTIERTIIESIPFYQFTLPILEDLSLVTLYVTDQDENIYDYVVKWMNVKAGDYGFTIKTNSLREITLEFGDSGRFGRTLEANTVLNVQMVESYGYVDVTGLKEASLQEILTAKESKLRIRFAENGLVRMGADPLTIDQMRLLASYPTHDDNAVFLGNFEFLVRKKFMARTHYLNVWNESIHEVYFGASVDHINHLFVSFVPKNPGETALIFDEIKQLIGRVDSLYANDRTVLVAPEERQFQITIKGTLAPVHDVETVKSQIKTLLLSNYGKEQIAASYYLSNGFNLQEINRLITKNIMAFQDRQSDFKIDIEDLDLNPVKPNQWLYIGEDSILFDIKRSKGMGESKWTVL